MKVFAVASIVLLVSLASFGLPLSQATKVIVDHGYVIFEGSGTEFGLDYNYYKPEIVFVLRDRIQQDGHSIGRTGTVWVGNRIPGDIPNSDIMEMSFVLELVGDGELPMTPLDEDQVWYKESSASLLDKVHSVSGNVAIRELHAAERNQMDQFKQSPHATSHQFQFTYENGTAHLQTNVKETSGLNVGVMSNNFQMSASHEGVNLEMKSIYLFDIEGKSFAIEDAAESNCESLESSGFQGYCSGNIWVELL